MHIAVAGNIGAGKTTLTRLLAKHYNWEAHFEDVVENPYLDDFYNQMERWSFNLQIYFLNSRRTETNDHSKCWYLYPLHSYIHHMQICSLSRSPKVKRSQNLTPV